MDHFLLLFFLTSKMSLMSCEKVRHASTFKKRGKKKKTVANFMFAKSSLFSVRASFT